MSIAIGILGLEDSVSGIRNLLAALPQNLPAAIAVLVPMKSMFRTLLPDFLGHGAVYARERDVFEPGRILVVPPGNRMRIRMDHTVGLQPVRDDGKLAAIAGPLFISLADVFASNAVALVYSGWDDSISAIKSGSGTVIIRERNTSIVPTNAGLVVPRDEIAAELTRLMGDSPVTERC